MRPLLSCVVFAMLVAPAAARMGQDSSHDYPQWRGRNRDGAASAFSKPETWPDTLTLRWRVDVGEGYATPLIIGDKVYAFTRRDGREGITALDANTGETIWRTDYPVSYELYEGAVDYGDGPRATPLVHNGRLYTVGISGTISSFDPSNGSLAWQRPVASVQPDVGFAASPVGDRDLVIVQEGYDALTAFEAATGRVRWTAKNEFRYASPIVVDLRGTRQVVAAAQHAILGISIADGAVLWHHPWKSPYVQAITPLLYRDTIIVSGEQRGVMALRPTMREDTWGVEMVWETQDVSMYLSNPVIVGDALFGLSHRNRGQYFALDASTGRVLWLGRPRRAVNSALVKADDLIFYLNDDAELIVARSSRSRDEPLKSYRVADSATWAQPAISGDRIFVKGVSSLACWTVR